MDRSACRRTSRCALSIGTAPIIASTALGAPSESVLYGLTTTGQLVSIDLATGATTSARVPLPAPFTTCDSFECIGRLFYASYGGGKVVQFGFDCGDQVDLGPSGFQWIEAIARRPDGTTYASVSFNNDVGAEAVGVFDPATGDVSGAIASMSPAQVDDIDAMAFAPDGTLRVVNLDSPRTLATFDLATGAISNLKPLTLLHAGIAFSHDGSTIYSATIGSPSCIGVSTLATIDPSTGAEATIGSMGLPCIVGLSWGPPVPAASADLNQDGTVDGADLGVLLAAWRPCPAGCCPADLNRDGTVDGADLGLMLAAWGSQRGS